MGLEIEMDRQLETKRKHGRVPEGLRTNPAGMRVDFLFFMIVF